MEQEKERLLAKSSQLSELAALLITVAEMGYKPEGIINIETFDMALESCKLRRVEGEDNGTDSRQLG